jgi:iron complex outermembrane receptor protein
MSLKTTRLRDAISFALAVSAMAGTGAAFAQDPAPAAEQSQEPVELDRIEVTGSRIPKADIETAQPIITLTRDQIEQQGFNSVVDILQNLTSAGTPAISRADALSSGENVGGYYIDLRNLGAARTLVLVNGRRLGVTTSGLQDLSQIPMSAIERIEVLKDGASSIYGSDAIAGVVNIITRRNFEGAEANAYMGTYDEGDGTKQSYDFTLGAQSDRGGIIFSAEYSKEEPVFAGDREFTASGRGGYQDRFPYLGWSLISQNGVWLGNQGAGGPVFGPDPRWVAENPGADLDEAPIVNLNFVLPGCAEAGDSPYDGTGARPCTLNKGSDPRAPGNYHTITPAERANSNEQMMLQTGIERRSLFVSSFFDITDTLRFTADIGYNSRTTDQQIAGYPNNYGYGLLSAESYFNPNPAAGDAYWYRRGWEQPRQTERQLDTYRVSMGLEGVLEFGDRQWDWDVGFLSNRNHSVQQGRGDFFLPHMQQALGASFFNPETGRVECGTADNPTPYGSGSGQCIPWNPLLPYGEAGEGSLGDPALQTYLFPYYTDRGVTRTTDYTANLAGTLFSLPAGDVGMAVGIEHRREYGKFVPDASKQTGQTTDLGATTTLGSYDLNEAYVELDIPLLSDMPFARELALNVASRYSDYSNFGETINNKFQLRWRPMDGLLIRATYADGFRAPDINSLYGGTGTSFEFYTDPCDARQAGAGNPACTAVVPPGFIQLGQGNVPCAGQPCQTNNPFVSGSNPDLQPETSESWTAGVVWSPQWVEGLDLNLDWYKVSIESVISQDTVDSILRDCYVNNIASRCEQGQIVRAANGSIQSMFFGLTNLGQLETEGYDFGVNYRLPELAVGQFTVNWQNSYTSKYDTLADNDPATRYTGQVGWAFKNQTTFRVRSNLGVTWQKGDWSASYTGRYYSGLREICGSAPLPCSNPDHVDVYGEPAPFNSIGSNTFHDMQVSVKLPWNGTASVGANNITDHIASNLYGQPSSSFPYYGGFDIGRFWYFKYQQRF